ncbi:MAG: hypothetical protein IPL55_03370 [Saprospiraceae bacterium]|nr:hypothetical protein [Saprospiraceae bacterium]
MANLLKHIRQSLLSGKGIGNSATSTNKYLKYAFGEIVLVVIGILIALQINNWNENRKERIQEKIYLKRFEVELNTDNENILNSISVNKSRILRAKFLLRAIENPQLAEDSSSYLIKSIEHAGYTFMPIISDNAFEELKSSGNLSLISNEDLRVALQKYYSWTSKIGQWNFLQQDVQLNYTNIKQGILTASQIIDLGNYDKDKHYNAVEGKKAFQHMMDNPKFLEFLPYVIQNKIDTEINYNDVYNQAKALKTMLKKELDKQK